ASAEKLREFFPLLVIPATRPRSNIAPTQQALADRQEHNAQPRAAPLRWALIPSRAQVKEIGASLINPRADTVAGKPTFRASVKPGALQEMLRTFPSEGMTAVPVGPFVNNARNEGAECLAGTDPVSSSTLFQ